MSFFVNKEMWHDDAEKAKNKQNKNATINEIMAEDRSVRSVTVLQ